MDVQRWNVGAQKLFGGIIVAEDVVGIWFNTGMQGKKTRERKARIWDFDKL